MTQVTPTCSVCGHGGLPADSARAGEALLDGGGLSGLPFPASVGRRLLLSAMRKPQGAVAGSGHLSAVPSLRASRFRDGRYDFRAYAYAVADLVPRDLVGGDPEERGQRLGAATRAWSGKLRDGMDLAAQDPASHGSPRPGQTFWPHRGGRDLSGRQGGRRPRSGNIQEGFDRRCYARGWERDRADSHAPDSRGLGQEPASIRRGRYRAGKYDPYGWLVGICWVGCQRIRARGERPQAIQGIRERSAAAGPSRSIASEALDSRHPSGCSQCGPSGLLPR